MAGARRGRAPRPRAPRSRGSSTAGLLDRGGARGRWDGRGPLGRGGGGGERPTGLAGCLSGGRRDRVGREGLGLLGGRLHGRELGSGRVARVRGRLAPLLASEAKEWRQFEVGLAATRLGFLSHGPHSAMKGRLRTVIRRRRALKKRDSRTHRCGFGSPRCPETSHGRGDSVLAQDIGETCLTTSGQVCLETSVRPVPGRARPCATRLGHLEDVAWSSPPSSPEPDPVRGRPHLRRLPGAGSVASWPAIDAEGEAAFSPRSRAPKTSPAATAPETVELVLRLRKHLDESGLDAGADTLDWHLKHHHQITLARATINRILVRAGADEPRADEATQVLLHPVPSRPAQRDLAIRLHPLPAHPPRRPVPARTSRSSAGSTTTPATPCTSPPTGRSPPRSCSTTFKETAGQHGIPASTLTDNGMVYTVRLAGHRTPRRPQRVRTTAPHLARGPEELQAQPPHHLREGRDGSNRR